MADEVGLEVERVHNCFSPRDNQNITPSGMLSHVPNISGNARSIITLSLDPKAISCTAWPTFGLRALAVQFPHKYMVCKRAGHETIAFMDPKVAVVGPGTKTKEKGN